MNQQLVGAGTWFNVSPMMYGRLSEIPSKSMFCKRVKAGTLSLSVFHLSQVGARAASLIRCWSSRTERRDFGSRREKGVMRSQLICSEVRLLIRASPFLIPLNTRLWEYPATTAPISFPETIRISAASALLSNNSTNREMKAGVKSHPEKYLTCVFNALIVTAIKKYLSNSNCPGSWHHKMRHICIC